MTPGILEASQFPFQVDLFSYQAAVEPLLIADRRGLRVCASDEELYEIAAREVATRTPIPGLWAKAFVDTNGDEKATMIAYIRLRVTQLQDEYRQTQREAKREIKQRQFEVRLAGIEKQYAESRPYWRKFKLREVRDPLGAFMQVIFWLFLALVIAGGVIAVLAALLGK
ncbi:MAG: hypothetical protein HOP29_03290 [Phycisphaerales bacterium]|nr:hypothetical protein [Phycisphaerales bacterium]